MDMCRTTIYVYLMISTSLSPSEVDALEIFPANIFGESTAKAGQNVKLKCSISHIQSSNQAVNMYLCKNGVGERLQLLENKDEHTFTLSNISLQDSGIYSCVYSFKLYPTKTVRGSGKNSIHVQVNGDALEIFPAQIFGTSTAKVGEHLILQCSISHIQSSNQAVHMYLCKNGVGEKLQLLENKDEHTFTLSNISLQDSGSYSCVYSFTRYYTKDVRGSGENSIHVQVTDPRDNAKTDDPVFERNLVRLVFSLGVIMFACFVVVFDIKTRSHDSRKFTSSVKTKDEIDA